MTSYRVKCQLLKIAAVFIAANLLIALLTKGRAFCQASLGVPVKELHPFPRREEIQFQWDNGVDCKLRFAQTYLNCHIYSLEFSYPRWRSPHPLPQFILQEIVNEIGYEVDDLEWISGQEFTNK